MQYILIIDILKSRLIRDLYLKIARLVKVVSNLKKVLWKYGVHNIKDILFIQYVRPGLVIHVGDVLNTIHCIKCFRTDDKVPRVFIKVSWLPDSYDGMYSEESRIFYHKECFEATVKYCSRIAVSFDI